MSDRTIAARLFDATFAEAELDQMLDAAGMPFESFGWDYYDQSFEIHGVPADYRATEEVQRVFHEAGFLTVYVNHADQWETHYTFKPGEPFSPQDGWRVSYGHKRKRGGPILVERPVPSWPAEWFTSGKAVVVSPARALSDRTE